MIKGKRVQLKSNADYIGIIENEHFGVGTQMAKEERDRMWYVVWDNGKHGIIQIKDILILEEEKGD